ncbi:hypothetical protein GYMLUDRAFT_262748 [Collybiopsis luxurians FD-317 M1]|uniref:Amino acid permease n=1 Tax=Collybiopsis luxurians FD-317 M1 TaxID=944289 RepID=A0A0D0CQV0_9AGAR|nr:hypothetical protein GYMLUDRAFT_262748 [Collybiopsis luxurians FD-317 M1]
MSGSLPSIVINDNDPTAAAKLKLLGYDQQLTRTRGIFNLLFMILAIIGLPAAMITPLATSLICGGPATMLWGFVLSGILTVPLAFSLAEISSKYPTSAGTYYWSYQLASPRRRTLYAWINGWLFLVGMWTITLSAVTAMAQLVTTLVQIFRPDYVPQRWHTYLILLAFIIFAGVVCIFGNEYLPAVEACAAGYGLTSLIILLISISSKAEAGRRSAAFAFGHFDVSFSGWTPGWAFIIGLLPGGKAHTVAPHYASHLVIGSLHIRRSWNESITVVTPMAEEAKNPSVNIPRAIVWTIPLALIMGIMTILPIVFTLPVSNIGDLVVLNQPAALLFRLVMGSNAGALGMWLLIFIACIFAYIPINTTTSRATWSFARDKAIPFHNIWSHVNDIRGGVPIPALLLSLIIQALLGLIDLGSTTAFNSFVGIGIICLTASYAMPVAISLGNGRKDILDAPFKLGRWGPLFNVLTVLWVLLQMVLLSMPLTIPTSAQNMNYASAIFVGFAVISAVYYVVRGSRHFKGPPDMNVANAYDLDGDESPHTSKI